MTGTYTVGGKTVSLTQSDYVASGGEGAIFVKGHDAYKLYHEASKMIPEGKIVELSVLRNLNNVLGPQEVIYKNNNPVGFVMKYVKNCEFLCKLFSKGFRDRNGFSNTDAAALVKIMQDTLKGIHAHKILGVDLNENNFLTSAQFDNVYFIDVDSYKTASYPATALMESVRDRKVKGHNFTELSDWFSMAITMFQLYIGCHPYKGRHPDFAPKDWMEMMDKGISVFNKKCKLPPACQDLNVIPKGHLRWFESIFEKGDRTLPPEPDAIAPMGSVVAKVVLSNDKFDIVEVRNYKAPICVVRFIDGVCWVITDGTVWGDSKTFFASTPVTGYTQKRIVHDLVATHGDKPVWLRWNKINGTLSYSTYDNVSIKHLGEIACQNGFFVLNRCVYTVVRDSLVELSFRNSGVKINALQQYIANIFHNHKIFDGIVLQDMLGTCRAAIPYEAGRCAIVRIKELDRCRVVGAKYDSGVAIIIAERNGKYERHTLIFNKDHTSYSGRVEHDAVLEEVNFSVKDNGVCIAENGDKLEIFLDNAKVKVVDSPLNGGEKITIYKNDTYIVDGNSLYKISAK